MKTVDTGKIDTSKHTLTLDHFNKSIIVKKKGLQEIIGIVEYMYILNQNLYITRFWVYCALYLFDNNLPF